MSARDVETESEALALATRLAESSGLELLPIAGRERTPNGMLTRAVIRGELSGARLVFELRFVDAGPIAELSAVVDVTLSPQWVDMLVIGRSMPAPELPQGPISSDVLSEFSVRTDDEAYVGALLSDDVEKVLLAANYAGYRPRLDHDSLHLSAGALDPPGAEKLLRHAARLGSLIETRARSIPPPAQGTKILAVLAYLAKALDARLDRDVMRLELRRVDGTLELEIAHHGYAHWSTRVQFRFERALPVTLSIAPVKAFYETWFRPDIRTGDSTFDRAFTVRGEPEERVLALLGKRCRGALGGVVGEARDVLVKESGITLQVPAAILDASRLRRLLDSVLELAEALTAHASGPRAYR